MSKLEYMCKGDWRLGTACGKCQKCILDAPIYMAELEEKAKPMKYLLVHDYSQYEGPSVYEFDLLNEVCQHLEDQSSLDPTEYDLYEITRVVDVNNLIVSRAEAKEAARQAALAKLSHEECELLGLTKA